MTRALNSLLRAQDACREILDAAGVDVAEPFDVGNWSEVALRLRDAGHEAIWEEARAAILAADPEANA